MRLLFISPKFNNYHALILNEMSAMTIEADFFYDKPQGLIYRTLSFISSSVKKYLNKLYLNGIIKTIKDKEYSHVLVIKGTILDEEFMITLREFFPDANFIMYQWDSTLTHNSFMRIANFFDNVFTFDMNDSNDYNFEYLPLFFSGLYENLTKKINPEFDLVFVGEFYPDSDRLTLVKKIAHYMEEQNLNFYYSLRVEFFALLKFILFRQLKLRDLPHISVGRISQDRVIDLYSNSSAVLDIEHLKQNGLTIRSMEVLGAGLKLITTNKNIIYEDFFSKKSIVVLDRENINLDITFFNNDQIAPIDKKYSLKSWLSHILQY
jgi:hypothetical protein